MSVVPISSIPLVLTSDAKAAPKNKDLEYFSSKIAKYFESSTRSMGSAIEDLPNPTTHFFETKAAKGEPVVSPDCSHLAFVSNSKSVTVMKIGAVGQSPQQVYSGQFEFRITSLLFSADSSLLVIHGLQKKVFIFKLASAELVEVPLPCKFTQKQDHFSDTDALSCHFVLNYRQLKVRSGPETGVQIANSDGMWLYQKEIERVERFYLLMFNSLVDSSNLSPPRVHEVTFSNIDILGESNTDESFINLFVLNSAQVLFKLEPEEGNKKSIKLCDIVFPENAFSDTKIVAELSEVNEYDVSDSSINEMIMPTNFFNITSLLYNVSSSKDSCINKLDLHSKEHKRVVEDDPSSEFTTTSADYKYLLRRHSSEEGSEVVTLCGLVDGKYETVFKKSLKLGMSLQLAIDSKVNQLILLTSEYLQIHYLNLEQQDLPRASVSPYTEDPETISDDLRSGDVYYRYTDDKVYWCSSGRVQSWSHDELHFETAIKAATYSQISNKIYLLELPSLPDVASKTKLEIFSIDTKTQARSQEPRLEKSFKFVRFIQELALYEVEMGRQLLIHLSSGLEIILLYDQVSSASIRSCQQFAVHYPSKATTGEFTLVTFENGAATSRSSNIPDCSAAIEACFIDPAANKLVLQAKGFFAVLQLSTLAFEARVHIENRLKDITFSRDGKFAMIAEEDYNPQCYIFRCPGYSKIHLCMIDMETNHSAFCFSDDSTLAAVLEENCTWVSFFKTANGDRIHRHDFSQLKNVYCQPILSIENKVFTMWTTDLNHLVFSQQIDFNEKQKPLGGLFLSELTEYFVSTNPDARKEASFRMLNSVRSTPGYRSDLYQYYTVILYNLNDKELFDRYCSHVGIEDLFLHHDILRIYFAMSQNSHSMEAILEQVEAHYQQTGKHVRLDHEKTRSLILHERQTLIKEELGRKMLTLLLFSPSGKSRSCQLKEPDYDVAQIDIGTNRYDYNESLEHVVDSAVKSLVEEDPHRMSKHTPHTSLCSMDLNTGSEFSRALFSTFERLSDDDLKSQFKSIVYYKWNRLFKYAFGYSLVYWTMTVLAYVFFSGSMDSIPLGVAIIALNGLIMLGEVKSFCSDCKSYCSSLWNWNDLVLMSLCAGTVLAFLSNRELNSVAQHWVRACVVTLLGLRSMTWLRIFRPTRYLITMVLQVFSDIIAFLVILTAVVFIFAFLWRLSPGLGLYELEKAPLTFYESIYDSVFILFGGSPVDEGEDGKFNVIRFLVIILGNVVLALALLNFLIAIISGTFERVESEKELHDVKELLGLIVDFDSLLAGVSFWRKNRLYYYMSLLKDSDSEDLISPKLDSLNSKVDALQLQTKELVDLNREVLSLLKSNSQKLASIQQPA